MIIYRLERKGIGPYVGGSGVMLFGPKRAEKAQILRQRKVRKVRASLPRPNVYDNMEIVGDHNKAVREGYVFGAQSKVLLKAYFGFYLKPYFQQGYKIRKYNVPDEEVIDMLYECAFPAKYHRFGSADKVRSATRLKT